METNAFRILEGLSDVVVVMQEGKVKAAALLIRPIVTGAKFQVCIIRLPYSMGSGNVGTVNIAVGLIGCWQIADAE